MQLIKTLFASLMASFALALFVLPASALAQVAATSDGADRTFNIHSSAGVQSERGISVLLRDGEGPEYEVFIPELLVQMAREANRGTIAMIPTMGHIVVLPMPDFALRSVSTLPLLYEIDEPDHRVFELLPAGSTDRNFRRAFGMSVKTVEAGLTAEEDSRAFFGGLRDQCLLDNSGYQQDSRRTSGRSVMLAACANFKSDVVQNLDPSIRGSIDIALSYVLGETVFRFYSIHRSASWDPDSSEPPLDHTDVREIVSLLDRAMIFEDIERGALIAAFAMAGI